MGLVLFGDIENKEMGKRGWAFTGVVDYDHGTDTRNGVETVDAPQRSGIDAAAGVADDGGFCAWLVV